MYIACLSRILRELVVFALLCCIGRLPFCLYRGILYGGRGGGGARKLVRKDYLNRRQMWCVYLFGRMKASFRLIVLFLVWAGHSKGQTGLVGLRAYFVCRSCAIVLGPPAFSSLARLSSAMDAMAGGRRKTTDCAGPGGLVLRVLCVFKTLFCQSFTCSL